MSDIALFTASGIDNLDPASLASIVRAECTVTGEIKFPICAILAQVSGRDQGFR